MDLSASIVNFVVLACFGLLLASLVYSRSAHRKSAANMTLAILLVAESLRIMTIFVDYNRPLGDISAASPFVFSRLLNGPLIYLYARLVLGLQRRLQRRDLRHFVPFLIILIVVYLSPVLRGDLAGRGEWRSNVNFNVTVDNVYPLLVLAFMMIVLISYSIATLKLISLNRHKLVNLYADYESISLKWLRALCYVHLLIAIMAPLYFLVVSQISAYIGAPMAFFSYSFITTAFLFFFITVYGFQQPVVFVLV